MREMKRKNRLFESRSGWKNNLGAMHDPSVPNESGAPSVWTLLVGTPGIFVICSSIEGGMLRTSTVQCWLPLPSLLYRLVTGTALYRLTVLVTRGHQNCCSTEFLPVIVSAELKKNNNTGYKRRIYQRRKRSKQSNQIPGHFYSTICCFDALILSRMEAK